MGDFYSQAFNFGGAVQGEVDPRTGLFNAHLPLAQLVGNDNLGPSLTLALNYTPLDGAFPGVGHGCTLGLSHYDTQAKLLTLSTGERYKVVETSSQVFLQQQKLDGMRFEKLTSGPYGGNYKITYKSGRVELLRNDAYAVKVPVRIFSPAGHWLDLTWEAQGSLRRLVRVADETGTLFQATYGDSLTTMSVWPGRSEGYELRLTFRNGYLSRLENTAHDPVLAWTFTYDTVGSTQMLTKIEAPTGLIEQVIYKAAGHQFPAGANRPPLPCVTTYARYPQGGLAATVKTYEYSSTNYLGYGGNGGSWNGDQDYLYGVLTDYSYWSRETTTCDGRKVTTQRTYNNFHLLTQEVVTQDGCVRTTETHYYARVGVPFDQQPPQFQLPQSVTVTFRDGSDRDPRSEVTQTAFDAAGNPTLRVSPDGTRTEWTYYPAAGEAGKCPPEPNGFVRLMESETVTPPTVGTLTAPVQVTRYTYDSLPAVPGTPVPSAVVKRREDVSRGGQLLLSTVIDYVSDPHSADLGRMTSITDTLNVPGDTPSSFVSRHDFTFERQDGLLVQTVVFTGHDGLSTTRCRSQSRFSGRLWSEVNESGVETRYVHDRLGRILSRTTAPGTGYENTVSYQYALKAGDDGTSSTTVTDARGNQTRDWVDGLGRLLRRERLDADGGLTGWRTVHSCQYDAWGRVCSVTFTDVRRTDGTSMSSSRTLTYDGWGQNSLTSYSEGYQLCTVYDPVALQSETRVVDDTQGKEVRRYNLQGLPVEVTHVDHQGVTQGCARYAYDGLGRLRTLTDELGQVTSYDYDAWNRVVSITLPDGTVVEKAYAAHTSAPLVTGITVDGSSLGTQTFDGLGRLLTSRSGGRLQEFAYEDGSPVPASRTAPDGRRIGYRYLPELDHALAQVCVDDLVQDFTYDSTGMLTGAADSGGLSRTMTYTPSGRLQSETFRTPGGASRQTACTYSLEGRLQRYTDVAGVAQDFTYDDQGRAVGIVDPDMSVAIAYDALGRVSGWTVTDRRSGRTLGTQLDYDGFDREVRRTLSGDDTLVVSQYYRSNGQLDRRVTTRDGGTVRDERYGYDSRNRLVDYSCEGDGCPVDASGQPVRAQSFSYDALGSLTRCVTQYDNGSDTADFTYDTVDPTQLVTVTHTHPAFPQRIDLAYDAAGRLIRDEAGRTLDYDGLGRLTGVGDGASCRHDALGMLAVQTVGGETRELYYRGQCLVNEVTGAGGTVRLMRLGDHCVAQRRDGVRAGTRLFGSDAKGSVLSACEGGSRQDYAYAPYGYRPSRADDATLLGYDGERLDPVTGVLHLGNGYRAYSPVLMRFHAPDGWSPFGAGGINPYAYCLGDPVNRSDPSGHLSVQAWLGIGLGALGLVATAFTFGAAAVPAMAAEGIVAGLISGASAVGVVDGLGAVADVAGIVSGALEDVNPDASSVLGWVSLGFGLAGGMTEVAGKGRVFVQKVNENMAALSARIGRIQEIGLSGRGVLRDDAAVRPADRAFAGRSVREGDNGIREPRTRFRQRDGQPMSERVSSYPHVTPGVEGGRAEHVTSTRYVTTVVGRAPGERFEVLQRFSQDNVPGAIARHDRYIAVDGEGAVYNVAARLNPHVEHPDGAMLPRRGMTLAETSSLNLTFEVTTPAYRHPRLSLRTRARRLPDRGY
jgi:RHS repeat-associated protein